MVVANAQALFAACGMVCSGGSQLIGVNHMFGGVSTLSLDNKGRLALPVRHREPLLADGNGRLVVTLDSPRFLLVYPEKNWLPVMEKLAALPVTQPAVRAYARLLLGNAETLEIDAAGRVLLPARLRQKTGLNKNVALVGMGHRFELWNAQAFEAETDAALALSASALTELGALSL